VAELDQVVFEILVEELQREDAAADRGRDPGFS
jgi:hypothetical protein